jgi:hypothetical protein
MCGKERKKLETQLNTMIDCCYCYVCDICLCAFLRLRHFSCRAVSTLSFKTAAHVLDSEKLQDCHLATCSHLTGSEGMLMYKTDHTTTRGNLNVTQGYQPDLAPRDTLVSYGPEDDTYQCTQAQADDTTACGGLI